jgi:hypothetical protein
MATARWTILAMLAALVVALLALSGLASAQQAGTTTSPSATAQTEGPDEQLRVENPGGGNPGPLSPAQKLAISQGYLVPDQEAYEQAKAEAQQKAERLAADERPAPPAVAQVEDPEAFRSWQGLRDLRVGPSDSTGAIGPTRYIELINIKYAIYNRTSNRPIDTGELNELAGEPPFPEPLVFDPQITWDPATRRFYYVAADVYSATDNRLAFGFSKTASPSSAADFCKYVVSFGPRFPDYPKLGDTDDLLLIGVNSFGADTVEYLGSDLISITKPPAGSDCPSHSEFTVDTERDLMDAAGGQAFTPVPANQIDTGERGYVVAVPDELFLLGSADSLSVYEVTSGADGTLNLGPAERLAVPLFSFPASAPQPGTRQRLDTLDARNTQAILAKDPSRGGKLALWTQHTILGGSGAVVRWYEIDLAAPSLFQTGAVGGPTGVYAFNAAISPNRQVNGTTSRFGASMVMGFNTSSTARRPDIRMVSKTGGGPVSAHVLIKSSPTVLEDFTCLRGVCRWGDYSAAAPDPLVPRAETAGRVWLTNQWVKTPGGVEATGWSTWNWAATP